MKPPSIWSGKPQILIFPRAPLPHPIHQQFLVVLPPKISAICLLLFTTTQLHSIIISFLDNLLTGSACLHTGISSIHSPYSSWRKPLNANPNMLLPCSEAFSVSSHCSWMEVRALTQPMASLHLPLQPIPCQSTVLAGSNHSAFLSGPYPGKDLFHCRSFAYTEMLGPHLE